MEIEFTDAELSGLSLLPRVPDMPCDEDDDL